MQTFIFQGGKKKSAGLFPMAIVEITYYLRPDSELGKLTEARILEQADIRFDPIRSTIAFFMAQVVKHCLKTNQSDQALFDYVKLASTELGQSTTLTLFPLQFLVDFSMHLGVEPLVNEDGIYFHIAEGEINSEKKSYDIVEVGPHVALIRNLYLNQQKDSSYPKEVRVSALNCLIKYYEIHIPGFKANLVVDVLQETLS